MFHDNKKTLTRLEEAAKILVNQDQKGFMKGRKIAAINRKLLDLICHCNLHDKPALILNMDLEKAFDKLSFQAIFGCLQFFNSADYLIDWLKILYIALHLQNDHTPPLSNEIIKKIEHEMRSFIWSGKKSKIALNTLQKPKKVGGMALTDIRSRDIAIKLSWIKTLKEDAHTTAIAHASSGKIFNCLKENIWRVNLHWKDLKYLNIENPFWSFVLRVI